MEKRFLSVLLLFGLITVSAVAEASDLFGTIRLGGQAIANAELSLKGDAKEVKAKTNESGYYSIRGIDPGSYTMTIQMPDKSTRPVKVHVFPQSTEKNIELK